MKSFIAYCLLAVYLFSTTEVHELLRFPLLIEHFNEHKQKDTAASFVNFLEIHYSGNHSKKSEHDKGMELPFKSHDSSHNFKFVSLLPPENFPTAIDVPVTDLKTSLKYHPPYYSNTALKAIWQPPRIS